MVKKYQSTERGIILLFTLLFVGVLLAITASLLTITLKQFQISGIAYSSEQAFQAASAGAECLQYYDRGESSPGVSHDAFTIGAGGASISCMGTVYNYTGGAASGAAQTFQFDWGTAANPLCTEADIYKFSDASSAVPVVINGETIRSDCPPNVVCTVVKSRGYNASCGNITGNPKVVEREITYVY